MGFRIRQNHKSNMKSESKFSIKKRLASFRYAFNGLFIVFKEEHNARIHLVAAILVILLGLYFNISGSEWIAIIFAIGFVMSMEIINSSIENIADFISPEKHESIKKIKDLSAAAVLVSAIASAIVGLIIFLPRFLSLFGEG